MMKPNVKRIHEPVGDSHLSNLEHLNIEINSNSNIITNQRTKKKKKNPRVHVDMNE